MMPDPHLGPATVMMYEIRLKGILPVEWSDWFDGIMISHKQRATPRSLARWWIGLHYVAF